MNDDEYKAALLELEYWMVDSTGIGQSGEPHISTLIKLMRRIILHQDYLIRKCLPAGGIDN